MTLYKLAKQYVKTKSNQDLLFIVLLGITLVLDYWNVSYVIDFTQIMLIIGFIKATNNYSIKIISVRGDK